MFLLLLPSLLLVSSFSSSPPPNILYILADDLGYEDLGFQGSDIITPNIDKLAREGVILENHYVMPQCAPTRASLLTGRYAIRTGFWTGNMSPFAEWGLDEREVTMAEMLKEHGYATHLVGKWHLGMSRWSLTPTMRGFDTFLGQYQGSGDYFSHVMQGAYDFREDEMRQGEQLSDIIRYDLRGNYSTEIYTSRAEDLIRSASTSSQPWFLYLAYTAPHLKYQAPRDKQQQYASHMVVSSQKRKIYATMVSVMDEGVGRLMELLESTGARENTVVVFASDNGAQVVDGAGSNYPFKGGKRSLYEGGVRSVSFVNSPLLKKTGYVNRNIHHVVDWFPTFEHLAMGLWGEVQRDVDGVNIWPSLSRGESVRNHVLINLAPHGTTQAPPGLLRDAMSREEEIIQVFPDSDEFHFLHSNGHFVYRWYGWKLIVGEVGDEYSTASKRLLGNLNDTEEVRSYAKIGRVIIRVQLYNLHSDPFEVENVALDNPSVVEMIAAKTLDYRGRVSEIGRRTYSTQGKTGGVWLPWLDNDTEEQHPAVISVVV